ncbi:NADH dehydrogenase [ubiquinone] 1 alpha subcomplex assembly factor 2 [Ceratina calcarata]|uniref:NADH dehydrogenase [ubiquinone] 1 alpha subcomplex assembly factor 2 n=1 Tax=Ceratina calcarata TaxID=156304 RepID=A0AAJ7NB38_9HYME|nr:NADH dehydrogenase [ubiquinone] 1 alpha subcomplex assembly factor 2 [Ceratina calcarata]XP_017886478.1 NADH dehydrogenase [ubiquinone] 1 alpha subcomplex assembly factor 2 [Ceratina calcarata]XP_026672517.1 NADH dehydrogenase [ubiquinone] 1 alpha subcomplex assembly factor 2 [Ceratina calcarata]
MPGKERHLIRTILRNFVDSITPNNRKPKLIGEDYYGTKYYEMQNAVNTSKQKPARYFEPVNKNDFEQNVPAEWEAWLRFRRKEPPTVEEVEANYKLQLLKKERAAQLEATYSEKKQLDVPAKDDEKSFPVYEEYKNFGKDYKVKY